MAAEARREGRRLHISGMIVPWDQTINVGGTNESFAPGALDRQFASGRTDVELDFNHFSETDYGEPSGRIDPIGTMVDTSNENGGQFADFRLDHSAAARMAWQLSKEGTLDGFSVWFTSIDPPHNVNTAGQGRVKEAFITSVALTNNPAYTTVALAEARTQHPRLDAILAMNAGQVIPFKHARRVMAYRPKGSPDDRDPE